MERFIKAVNRPKRLTFYLILPPDQEVGRGLMRQISHNALRDC